MIMGEVGEVEVGKQKICFKGERSKMDMDKGATLRKIDGSQFLDKEKHTSRGSKLMNIDCLHLICAYSCAC